METADHFLPLGDHQPDRHRPFDTGETEKTREISAVACLPVIELSSAVSHAFAAFSESSPQFQTKCQDLSAINFAALILSSKKRAQNVSILFTFRRFCGPSLTMAERLDGPKS
jgi:hypothetical protein